MKKQTVYGLPLNPTHLLEQLKGASFCVSYATRAKLGKQLDQAIRLVGEDQILLVDNGAFSAWKAGVDTMSDENYLNGFAAWANDICERCPQAIVVLPDVIDGNVDQNCELVHTTMMLLNACDRAMPIWHMHEPIEYLLHLCEGFNYIGIGSSAQYAQPSTPAWHARIQEAFAAIAAWEAAGEGAFVRPRIHMMRAQSEAHRYDFDSSDSTNVAMNHNRWRKANQGEDHVARMAARVDSKIQASCDQLDSTAQLANPLSELWACTDHFVEQRGAKMLQDMGFTVGRVNADGSVTELSDEEFEAQLIEEMNEEEELAA